MAESLLPQQVLKNLSDRSSEKRKLGAQEVDKIIRRLPQEDVLRVVTLLATDFALSPNNNLRKGGLLALAQCAITLGPGPAGIATYLAIVVPPVLRNFADQEPRVRFYACESLFNIVKTCRCVPALRRGARGHAAAAAASLNTQCLPPNSLPPAQRHHPAAPGRHLCGRVQPDCRRGQ